MKPEYEAFVADKTNGADYIFKNWHTLTGGDWSSQINEKSKNEFSSFLNFIGHVMKDNDQNIQSDKPWRGKPFFDWFDEEERTQNLFTMQDEWSKYLESKLEKE